VHCTSQQQALKVRDAIAVRLAACGVELNQTKTAIVSCKDDDRRGCYAPQRFDFLGYTFRPRLVRGRAGKRFVGFTPAASNQAGTQMRREIRRWRLHLRPAVRQDPHRPGTDVQPRDQGVDQLRRTVPQVRVASHLPAPHEILVRWAMRKYKRLRYHRRRARRFLANIARREPTLFALGSWAHGRKAELGDGSRVSRAVHARFCEGRGV